ncbi:MAG: hypothetical protein EXR70_23055 [Deltaproteobacteria bacterium]|nr:hypothetical protein [Deltaproteobacteria bacterium]
MTIGQGFELGRAERRSERQSSARGATCGIVSMRAEPAAVLAGEDYGGDPSLGAADAIIQQ